ncbi:hypothetical protein BU25DRAFT_411721 [Macroventuria anomochaeta]|uniref:Uncharacterized protein n=1 Tax=Macroventuria anomochaeta TaxID=301207 RepID=A0ACB6RX60_9PLEO|nr:uncharacterized protein BU25DRAFT_411721 [Macroventuria anomochaeta]KAF2626308.1 hypothetical protein BU25DRAFT_411721 [Macroventuria anomochaeta]
MVFMFAVRAISFVLPLKFVLIVGCQSTGRRRVRVYQLLSNLLAQNLVVAMRWRRTI